MMSEYFVLQRQSCPSCAGTKKRSAAFWSELFAECEEWKQDNPPEPGETENTYRERVYTHVHLPYFQDHGIDPGNPNFYADLPPQTVWCEECNGTGIIESYTELKAALEAIRPRRGKAKRKRKSA